MIFKWPQPYSFASPTPYAPPSWCIQESLRWTHFCWIWAANMSTMCDPDGWKQVVWDWEDPDPGRALEVALKDWQSSWYSGSWAASQPSSSRYAQCRLIVTEFIDVYGLIYVTSGSTFCLQFFILIVFLVLVETRLNLQRLTPNTRKVLQHYWKLFGRQALPGRASFWGNANHPRPMTRNDTRATTRPQILSDWYIHSITDFSPFTIFVLN